MVDGEALAVTMEAISTLTGCWNSDPGPRIWVSRMRWSSIRFLEKVIGGLVFLGQGELICEGGPRGDVPGAGAAPGRGLGPTHGWDPPLLLGWPPSGSSASESYSSSKILLIFFLKFSANFSTLHKRKTPNTILLKTTSVRVSSKQFIKIRGKTIAKCLEK